MCFYQIVSYIYKFILWSGISIENDHMKTNLVHKIHRIRSFGSLKLQKFRIFLSMRIMLSVRKNAHWLYGILLLHIFLQLSCTRWVFNILMFTWISCSYIKLYYSFKLNFFNVVFSIMLWQHQKRHIESICTKFHWLKDLLGLNCRL